MRALSFVVLVVAACTPTRQWPDASQNVNTLKLTENGVEASREVAQVAVVEKNRLVFPASAAEEIRAKWPAGKSVVGAPSTLAGTTNPLGFIRKVKEVRVEGDQVIVETEPTTIDQMFDGELRLTVDAAEMTAPEVPEGVDLAAYLPKFPPGPATPYPDDLDAVGVTTQPLDADRIPLEPIGVKRQPLDLTTDRIDVPTVPVPVIVQVDRPIVFTRANGNVATARMRYRGRISLTPNLSVTPRLRLEVDTKNCPLCSLESFEFSLGGSISAGLRLDTEVSAEPAPEDVRGYTPDDLTALDDAVGQQPVRVGLPEVLIGKEKVKKVGSIYGVPVLLTTGVYGDCQFTLRGRYRGDASLNLNNPNFVVGVRYQDSGPKKDRWAPIKPAPFDVAASGRVISANGTFETECGLTLKATLSLADLAGPYAGIRNGVVGTTEFKDVACPANSPLGVRKTGTVTPSVKAFTSIEVGGEVSLLKLVSFGVGPFTLGKQLYREGPSERVPDDVAAPILRLTGLPAGTPLFARGWAPLWTGPTSTFERAGQCPSTCANGRRDSNETDVDCGGTCGGTCAKTAVCLSNADCRSRTCSGGTCRGGPSDDDVRNQGETDVDCGGPTNPLRCGLGRLCQANSDCDPGFCGKAVNGERRCTENLCLDGALSGSESDVDCGSAAGCSSRCAVGRRCLTSGDCESGACSVAGLCVTDTCVDGLRSGTEGDIDCGGPCARKCVLGDSCRPTAETDCASGICAASTSRCVADRCEDGRTNGSETDTDCGGSTCARRCPIAARCLASTDCQPGNVCNARTGVCSPPGCDDGLRNGQESSIDCGGPTCLKCAVSKACSTNADCVTNTCTNGRCVGGPCENGVKDATEADVDCGGSCGRPCATGRTCTAPSDCASNLCVSGVCSTDACRDLVRNGAETGVDCGGTTCTARCAVGVACTVNGDCASNLCNQRTNRCAANTCGDGALTAGSESDVDCGGACAAANPANACAVNQRCAVGTDCASGVCNATTLRCVPNGCFNGVRDGTETDLDCGGACEPRCAGNRLCTVNADCQSGVCAANGRCAPDQCSNGRLDGNETDLDCGGTCSSKCAVSRGCLVNADCVNPQGLVGVPGFCSVASRTCVTSSCNTGARDGTETGVDCGGGTCGTCPVGQGCASNTDCASNICNLTTRLCVSSRCEDGVRNATETDIDCGGLFSGCLGPNGGGRTCAVGQACTRPWDCSSGYCGSANVCVPPIRRSCEEHFVNGSRTSGMYLIDPDGPTLPNPTLAGTTGGVTAPFMTYCLMVTTPNALGLGLGGWTPIFYTNSERNLQVPVEGLFQNRRDGSQTDYRQCNATGFTCPAGDACVEFSTGLDCTASSSFCRCVGPNLWVRPPALEADPLTLSVSTPTPALQESISLATSTPASARTFSGNGPLNSPWSFRWTGYRNGTVVFDALIPDQLPSTTTNWPGTISQGSAGAPFWNGSQVFFGRSDFDWCSAANSYVASSLAETPAGLPSPFNDQDSVGRAEGACRRFGRNVANQFGIAPTSALSTRGLRVVNVTRILPAGVDGFTGNAAAPYVGIWIANYGTNNTTYGFPNDQIMTTQNSIGFCNGMSSTNLATQQTPCAPFRHPRTDRNGNTVAFSWGTGELSGATNRGSEFGSGVPGLVFVLWAR
ncbi:MAG: hypothetical protein MUC96_31830 [Myxococcaceae bacterium]|jgi:hypothetical protein|nr:hypothetical protein [Myxococcaceae bacterium]